MAPRAHWKGSLKLSLVSCPISLYPAISAAEKVAFRQINADTGNRLCQQLIDTVTGEVVERQRTGRGYEVGEDQFLTIGDDELAEARQEARARPFSAPLANAPVSEPEPKETPRQRALKLAQPEREESSRSRSMQTLPPSAATAPAPPIPRPIIENTRTIELDRFIPRDQIDPRYYNAPYYVGPRDEVGLEAYSVIRDAMTRQGLVGMGRIVLANRERPLFIEPMGLGMRAITLPYAHEVRSEAEYFSEIPALDLPEDMLAVTEHILSLKRENFDPAYLEDRYRTVLIEKLREKQGSLMPKGSVHAAPSRQNVINLMDALKASLEIQKPPAFSKSRTPSAKRSPAKGSGPATRSKAKR